MNERRIRSIYCCTVADLPVLELMTDDRKRLMGDMVIVYWKSIGQKVKEGKRRERQRRL